MNGATADMRVISGVGNAGWKLFECCSAASTNDLARDLPAWSAVRADVQTGGRGRFGRRFVSDAGGLWISAVLPADGGAAKWAGFSLMVGVHLVRMLEALEVPSARLRWPNDLMSGPKKLGGLLIEQSAKDVLVVGFGLNISNSPWTSDPSLEAISTSIARVSQPVPSVEEMAVRTLDALAGAHQAMEVGGMPAAIDELNSRWSRPVPVSIALSTGGTATGRFLGLDSRGHLRLLNERDSEFLVEHQSIEKLSEID
ncbi:MAG: biotin--[acetyl-CoA-carboxylase] ligase [Verrucomicrobia bacterium]|nr:biotin--[acetyl-CoA-carboxylase] ligase [Verrucomicrobiota bacterium]